MPLHAPPACRLLLVAGLLALPAGWVRAQNAPTPPAGTLQAPAAHKPATAPVKPPQAAPREPVHKAESGKLPVVKPQGPSHPQKAAANAVNPAVSPAGKPAVKPAAKPAAPAAPVAAAPAAPENTALEKGAVTGLALPRFVSLRADEVNMRRGPGTRYPVEWVYKRRDLPVEIERELENWRLIEDSEGVKGWVHQATLTGRRSVLVRGGDATLRHDPQDAADAVAVLQPGVVGRLLSCMASGWCQVQVGDYRGWLKRAQVWGTLPDEVVGG